MFTCLKESLYWGAWKDGRVGSWAYLLPRKHQGCNYISATLKTTWRLPEQLFHAKDITKKTFEEGKGRNRDAVGSQTSGMTTCKWERYHRHSGTRWEAKESSYIRHPSPPGDLYPITSGVWKSSGLTSGSFENQHLGRARGLQETATLLLKGQCPISLTPRPSTEAAVWKATGLYTKEIY